MLRVLVVTGRGDSYEDYRGDIMRDSLARLGIKRGSLLAFFLAYALVPLPLFEGNPTGFILSHDHSARYIKRNSINLDNHIKITAKINEAMIRESDLANRIQNKRMELMLLQLRLEGIDSSSASNEDKERKAHKIERRIDRLYDQLDKDGINHDEIRSSTWNLMIASQQ